MSEPAEAAAGMAAVPLDDGTGEIERILGIRPATARILNRAGYSTLESVKGATDDVLRGLGLESSEIDRIRTAIAARATAPGVEISPDTGNSPAPVPDGHQSVERWLQSTRKSERPKRRATAPAKDSTDVLRRWVDGDDRAMEAWIQASDVPRAAPAPAQATGEVAPKPALEPSAPGPEGTAATTPSAGVPANLVEREETVVRWLTDLFDRARSEQFDPRSLLQEFQELHRELYEERARRKQMDEELEHVKRGSIAVIKYVRSREAKAREQDLRERDEEIAELRRQLDAIAAHPRRSLDAPPGADPTSAPGDSGGLSEAAARELETRLRLDFSARERDLIEKETEFRRRIVQLEGEIRNLRTESQATRQREEMLRQGGEQANEGLEARRKAADARERELVLRENELRTKFEEIRIRADELERKRDPLLYKEKELVAWEEELKLRKKALDLETRRVEEAKLTQMPAESADAMKRLETLQSEIAKREEELRTREQFLHQRMEELEGLERTAAESEAEKMRSDVRADVAQAKTRSGVRRLDDLLFGGIPTGSQILVNGPAHTGKDVLARLFIAEGLKQGQGALWVVTDKTHTTIREEMSAIMASYPDLEHKGLVRYVDLYARSLGVTEPEAGVKLLSTTDKGFLEQLTQSANQAAVELKEKAGGYRVVFESVSTVTAYLDTTQTFRFLQPFTGRRKLDGAASYYLLETGMHSEADLEALQHMMDGSVNLKVDQLKTFLSVRGIADVQSRAWVAYTFSKKSFSLGSFSLDHIR